MKTELIYKNYKYCINAYKSNGDNFISLDVSGDSNKRRVFNLNTNDPIRVDNLYTSFINMLKRDLPKLCGNIISCDG